MLWENNLNADTAPYYTGLVLYLLSGGPMLFPQPEQCKHFMKLFPPIFLTQIAQVGTAVFSSIFSGQAGTIDLAGVAVGVNIWYPIFAGVSGIFFGITPILAQLRGARKLERIPFYIMQSIYIAAFFSLFILAAGYLVIDPFLSWLTLEPPVREIASGYMHALGIGVFPLFMIATLRNIVDAHGKTHISMTILLLYMAITIVLFRLLIFGGMGIPPMGGVGAGYAISIAAWISLFVFIILFQKLAPFNSYHIWTRLRPVMFILWIQQLRLGLPICIAIFCETSLFSIVGLLMSEYGTVFLAANQAAISYSTLTYTVPWSISLAATIVVGYEVGAKQYKTAQQYAVLCQMTALIIACFTSAATFIFINPIASLFTSDTTTFIHIKAFITFAVIFAFCDAMGTPVQGILRGYKDVKSITWIAFITYWIISLPLGLGLSHWTYLGAYGYWVGFIISLGIAAIAYNTRLWGHTAYIYQQKGDQPND
jgi:MATE family multidrug resistance protein